MDAEAYREYCRDRYHFEAMLETERLKMKADLEPKKVTIELMVELAVDAVSCPASILENVRTIYPVGSQFTCSHCATWDLLRRKFRM
jgi:hypothetical protein